MKDDIHKLNLRLPMDLVEEAKIQAAALGVSLNAYILFALSEQVKRARRDLRPSGGRPSKPLPARPVSSTTHPPSASRVSTAKVKPAQRVGRNDPCPCGSGRKAKHCHPENC